MKFKKKICVALASLILMSTTSAIAKDEITVKYGGESLSFDVPPQIINNRTMVPLRAIFETIGATVDWNNETKTVTSEKSGTTIKLTVGSPVMFVNDKSITLDTPACVIDNRTLVPLRAVSEAFNISVDWDSDTKTVTIGTKNESNTTNSLSDSVLAYRKVKTYLLLNGKKDSRGAYASITFVDNAAISIMYDPYDEYISFFMLRGSDFDSMLVLYENKVPTVMNKMRIDGTQYTIIGSYSSPQLTILSSDLPAYVGDLTNSTNELLSLVYQAYDILMNTKGIDVKISDFGINY